MNEEVIKKIESIDLNEDSILAVTISSKTTNEEVEEIMSDMSNFLSSEENDVPNVPMLIIPNTIGVENMTLEGLGQLKDDINDLYNNLESQFDIDTEDQNDKDSNIILT